MQQRSSHPLNENPSTFDHGQAVLVSNYEHYIFFSGTGASSKAGQNCHERAQKEGQIEGKTTYPNLSLLLTPTAFD